MILSKEEFAISFDRALLSKFTDIDHLPAAIDCGTELTKIVHSTESEDPDSPNCLLQFALFENRNFEEALDYLASKLHHQDHLNQSASGRKQILRVTGTGTCQHGDRIKERLCVDLEYVDVSASQCLGLRLLVANCPDDQYCHPPPAIDEAEFADMKRGEIFERVREAQVALIQEQSEDSKFPFLLVVCGSAAEVILVQEDGTRVTKHSLLLAGKSFLGICQLLIGTRDYSEIMRLASIGKRGNVDTQVRDILDEAAPDSPYGKMPPSMPLFGFGKAADRDFAVEHYNREDIAQSLVSSFAANLAYPVSQLASFEGVRNVYYCGNFFRHEFSRTELIKSTKLLSATDAMNVKFLTVGGHLAALGAMLMGSREID